MHGFILFDDNLLKSYSINESSGGAILGWIYVFFAAVVEVFWVLGLKYSTNLLMWSGTIIIIVISFYLVIKACSYLPSGTVYAVFTGSGAAAIALVDFWFLGAEVTIINVACIGLIIIGVVGIQLTTVVDEKGTKRSGG